MKRFVAFEPAAFRELERIFAECYLRAVEYEAHRMGLVGTFATGTLTMGPDRRGVIVDVPESVTRRVEAAPVTTTPADEAKG